jgi:hypothetical protein
LGKGKQAYLASLQVGILQDQVRLHCSPLLLIKVDRRAKLTFIVDCLQKDKKADISAFSKELLGF